MPSAVLPRTIVTSVAAPPSVSAPLDSTRAFVAAEGYRGPLEAVQIRNSRDLTRKLERTGVGIPLYDAVDVLLRLGVPEVYVSRIVGAVPVAATLNIAGTGGTVLTATANEVGEFGNGATDGYSVEVTSPGGGSNRALLLYRDGVLVSTSATFTTRAAALDFNDAQSEVTIALGAINALPTVAAAANLTGGDSDADTITDDEITTALDEFGDDLGPGQVLIPGRGTEESSTALLNHAGANQRTALVEIADGLAVGDIATLAAALRALGSGADGPARMGGAWCQHAVVAGLFGSGSTRTVPYTVIVAGLIAKLERAEGHPNVAPFGDSGVEPFVQSITRYFSAADAETLFGAGVNIVGQYQGIPRNASFRTLEEEDTGDWLDLAHTRLERAIIADLYDVGRKMGSRIINRTTINDFAAKARVRLAAYWKAGATFGDTADEAGRVDTDSVNDVGSMADREVNADVGFRAAEHSEFINISLAKIPITQSV